jgi:hypothetical protein
MERKEGTDHVLSKCKLLISRIVGLVDPEDEGNP